jgi:hypothetical protein
MSTERTLKSLMGIKDPGAETASTIGPTRKVGLSGIVAIMLKVTAVSGTSPTLRVKIQDGDVDPPTTERWEWPQISAVGEYPAYVRTTKNHVRYTSTIGGINPSFTYSVFVTS